MKQIFLLILLMFSALNAYEFKLNKKDMSNINKSERKSFILNRLDKYKSLKSKIKDYTTIRKLSHVNSFINRILPRVDSRLGIDDYWSTPKEFLIGGHGDCEDYAITKYFTLLELGINKKNLYFAVVDIKGRKGSHMVLLYKDKKHKTPLVLDNLSFKVIPFTKRKRLVPKFAFNEIDAYKFTPKKFTKKVRVDWGKEDKWNKLLNRVYKLKE